LALLSGWYIWPLDLLGWYWLLDQRVDENLSCQERLFEHLALLQLPVPLALLEVVPALRVTRPELAFGFRLPSVSLVVTEDLFLLFILSLRPILHSSQHVGAVPARGQRLGELVGNDPDELVVTDYACCCLLAAVSCL